MWSVAVLSQLQRYVLQHTAGIKFCASKRLVETFSLILAEYNAVLTGCTIHVNLITHC